MTDRPIELQKVVDEFEREWKTRGRPPIDAYLDEVSAEHHAGLLECLIPIDIARRTHASEAILSSDYAAFGETAQRIAQTYIAGYLGFEQSNLSVAKASPQTLVECNPSETEREVVAKATMPEVVGNYRLLQKLGEGGMGTVWMAEQERPVRRRVALKLIKTGADNKQILARFDAEQQALAMMNHENIAKVFEAGVSENGQPYFAMELVHGVPFHRYCDKNKLSIVERLNLFIPACRAIQHAHQKGIIHRDIKPSNVLVALYDGKPTAKVIDFGLAKALQHQSKLTDKSLFTEFGRIVGTLQYMSPEQADLVQLDIDTRTDIYSLGIMLYELLTGNTPIGRDVIEQQSFLKVLELIREVEPLRPSVQLKSLSVESQKAISDKRQIEQIKLQGILQGDLDWIVMKSIEKDRRRRYETANDFADDIARFLNGDTVSARPPTMSYRVQKYVRKNKGLVASLCSIASLFIIGLVGSIWFSLKMMDARRLADEKTLEAERNADTAKQFAEAALAEKTKAERALIRSLVSEAGMLTKLKDAPGWSWDAGERIDQAMALNPPETELVQLRSLKVACETGHDARLLIHLPGEYWSRLCFSRNGAYLAVGERNENGPAEVRVYSTKTWKAVKSLSIDDNLINIPIRLWQGRKHQEGVTTLAFSPNDRWLIAGSRQGQLCVWDVDSDFDKVDQWTAFEKSSVETVVIGADDLKIVALSSGTSSLECKAWEFRDAKWQSMDTGFPQPVDALFSGHRDRIGVRSGGKLFWFDNSSFQSAPPLFPSNNTFPFLSQSGMQAANIAAKIGINLNSPWTGGTNKLTQSALDELVQITKVVFGDDDRFLVVGSSKPQLTLVVPSRANHKAIPIQARINPDVAVSSAAPLVAATTSNGIDVIEARTRAAYFNRIIVDGCNSVDDICFESDGLWLAAKTSDSSGTNYQLRRYKHGKHVPEAVTLIDIPKSTKQTFGFIQSDNLELFAPGVVWLKCNPDLSWSLSDSSRTTEPLDSRAAPLPLKLNSISLKEGADALPKSANSSRQLLASENGEHYFGIASSEKPGENLIVLNGAQSFKKCNVWNNSFEDALTGRAIIKCAAIADDNLLCGCGDGFMRLFDPGASVIARRELFRNNVDVLACDVRNGRFIVGTSEGQVCVGLMPELKEQFRWRAHERHVMSAVWLADNYCATSTLAGELMLWNIGDDAAEPIVSLATSQAKVKAIRADRSGKWLGVLLDNCNEVLVWSIEELKAIF